MYVKENSADNKIDALIKDRDGEPGTLFNFLNESTMSWRETIGKVVSRELLFKKGLTPSLDNESDSLFGVTLDLNSLTPVVTDPEIIDGKIILLDKERKTTQSDIKAVETALNTVYKRQQGEETVLAALQSEFKNQERALEHLNNTYNTINQQVKQDKVAAKKRLEAQVETAKANFDLVNENITSYKEGRANERQAISNTLSQGGSDIQTRYKTAVADIKQQRKKAAENKTAEIKDLDESLRLALEGNGIDPAAISQLKTSIDTIKKEIVSLKKKESDYGAYLEFLNGDYAKLGEMKAQSEVLQAEFENAKKLRKEELGKNTDFMNKHKQLLGDLEGLIIQKQKERNRLDSSLLANEVILNLNGTASDDDKARWALNETPTLINKGNEIVSELSTRRRQVENMITDFTEGFTLYVGSISHKYWTEHVLPNSHDNQSIAKSVIQYFNTGEHEENVNAVLQRLQILNNIDTYRRHIERFSSKVNSFNRQLNDHISDSMTFHAISDIQVNIEFSPEKLDHWSDIEKVSKYYEAWRSDERKIPSQDLINSLRNFSSRIPTGTTQQNNTELWRQIKFSVDLMENGNSKHITSEQGLKNPSSNGLSYLILIVVFLGFIDMHRSDKSVSLSWSLDELGNIDEENTRALLKLLSDRNVFLVSACPHLSHAMQGAFKYRYLFQKKDGRSFVVDLSKRIAVKNPFQKNVKETV
ncbi:MAG: ATP-binding protein [Opitutaceae bacterium]|nr:ATP-binding protein [Opitutaceae bacterium]